MDNNDKELNKIRQDAEEQHKQFEERMDKRFNKSMEMLDNMCIKIDGIDSISNKVDSSFERMMKNLELNEKWLKALFITVVIAGIILIVYINCIFYVNN